MAAQSFKEWFDIVTDVGNLDPFYGFTAKGIAHIGWDAAIKSLEGVQTQTTNSSSHEMPSIGEFLDWVKESKSGGRSNESIYYYLTRHFGH